MTCSKSEEWLILIMTFAKSAKWLIMLFYGLNYYKFQN